MNTSIWQGFLKARAAGRLPESTLREIEAVARELLEFGTDGKQPTRAALLRALGLHPRQLRDAEIVKAYAALRDAGVKASAIPVNVAAKFSVSCATVSRVWRRSVKNTGKNDSAISFGAESRRETVNAC